MPNNQIPPRFDREGQILAVSPVPILEFDLVVLGTDLQERFGVTVAPDQDVRRLSPVLKQIDRIDIVFPAFRDGRGYSTARILTEDMGFKGRLYAVGEVLRDQLGYLVRCGFNGFQIRDPDPREALSQAKARYGVSYQNTGDAQPTAWDLRSRGEAL